MCVRINLKETASICPCYIVINRTSLYDYDMELQQRWEDVVCSLILEKDGRDVGLHVTSLMSLCSIYTEC